MNIYVLFAYLIIGSTALMPRSDSRDIREQHIDFDQAMQTNTQLYLKKFTASSFHEHVITMLKNLYENNNLQKVLYAIQPSIPRIIHHIALDGIPQQNSTFLASWKSNHPEWQHSVWTDTKIKLLGLKNSSLYEKTNDPIEKANIARYEILYRFGGVCVAHNLFCVQSVEPLHHMYSFYVGIAPLESKELLSTDLIAAAPGHPILEACIKRMSQKSSEKDQSRRNGSIYFSTLFSDIANSAEKPVIAFPPSYFFLPYQDMQSQNESHPETFTLKDNSIDHNPHIPASTQGRKTPVFQSTLSLSQNKKWPKQEGQGPIDDDDDYDDDDDEYLASRQKSAPRKNNGKIRYQQHMNKRRPAKK